MNRWQPLGLAAILLAVLLAGVPPRFSWGRALSLEDCARVADVIFVGTVTDITARWGDTGKLIWTDYIFQVQETWKGASGGRQRTVSVGGGTIGGKTIKLTEVPTLELGATYIVYAHDNAKHYAEAVVGVEQGLFREVEDADTGARILIDAQGYQVEALEGKIIRGRLTQRVGNKEVARVMTDEELVRQQELFEAQYGQAPIPPPVVRDATGRIIPTSPPPVKSAREKAMAMIKARPRGAPLNREGLKAFTRKALSAPAPVDPAINNAGGGTQP